MWQSLRSVAEALLSGDVGLANAIFFASSLKSTTGLLDVVYDERGFEYSVPMFCYSDPLELVNSTSTSRQSTAPAGPGPRSPNSPSNNDNHSSTPLAPAAVPELKVKLRINPGDYNIVLDLTKTSTILELKRRIREYTLQVLPSSKSFD